MVSLSARELGTTSVRCDVDENAVNWVRIGVCIRLMDYLLMNTYACCDRAASPAREGEPLPLLSGLHCQLSPLLVPLSWGFGVTTTHETTHK